MEEKAPLAHKSPEAAMYEWWRSTRRIRLALVVIVFIYVVPALVDPWISPLSPRPAFLSAVPAGLLFLMAWGIFRRPYLGAWLTGCGVVVLYALNSLKLQYLRDVIIPHDIQLLGQFIRHYNFFIPYVRLDLALLGVGIVVGGGLLFLRFERPVSFPVMWHRCALIGLAFLGLAGLLSARGPIASIYAYAAVSTDIRPNTSARQIGLIPTIVRLAQDMRTPLPEPDEDLLADYDSSAQYFDRPVLQDHGMPDILVLMAESFFDPRIINDLDSPSSFRVFSDVTGKSALNDLVVPAGSGGGTMQTEFEFLTGSSLGLLHGHPHPYYSLITRSTNGLPRIFNSWGYRTVAIHPNRSTFYNRNHSFRHLGFDSFLDISYFSDHRDGPFISDSVLVDVITSRFTGEKPVFAFAVSIEGHGPWTNRQVAHPSRLDSIPVPEELDPMSADELRSVLYHLDNAAAAYKRLIEFGRTRERPFIILHFGDHLPAIHRVYETLGFRNGLNDSHQFLPYSVWSSTKGFLTSGPTCAHFLSGILLDAAGLPAPSEFGWNRHLGQSIIRIGATDSGWRCELPDDLAQVHPHLQFRWLQASSL